MGTINIQSTDLSHKAGLTYTGTSDKTIDVNNVLQTSDITASIANGKVVVDSSGNVGIGVTPSGWGFGGNTVLNEGAYYSFKGARGYLSANVYYNGGDKYATSGEPATMYSQNYGVHSWQTAPSGTAGNAITFTQAMTLAASGRLGIGTSSPSAHLTVGGNSDTARILPATDNVGYIGEQSHRWQALYAVTGTIQTSDERQKTDIQDSQLGLDFIKSLRPVSYKWKVGGYDVGDGIEIELEPAIEATYDEEGNELTPAIPAVKGLPKTEIAGKRTHYGFIAQEVKAVLGDTDFGGWVLADTEDSESAQSLRYDQFISPIVKALQEAVEKIEQLEARIEALETK